MRSDRRRILRAVTALAAGRRSIAVITGFLRLLYGGALHLRRWGGRR
ncbi:MAG: hypothetical protein WKF47_18925 [Geodermatophilaceae bacterium]